MSGCSTIGSQDTFLFFLPFILLITLYVVFLRERPGEKRFPWSEGETHPINLDRHVGAWLPIFVTPIKSLLKVDSLKLLGAAALARTGGGMQDTLWPIIARRHRRLHHRHLFRDGLDGGLGHVGHLDRSW